jgi:hypothetical protein
VKTKALIVFVLSVLVGLQLISELGSESAPTWTFQEAFDGIPGQPLPWESAHWDVIVTGSSAGTLAGHGPDCSAPPALHGISGGDDSIFVCNNHLMTTVNAGYAVLSFMPRQQFDWNGRTGTLEFETNLYGFGRSWWDIYIVPQDEMLLDIQHPDEGGTGELYPRRAVRFSYLGGAPEVAVIEDYRQVYKFRHWQNYGQAFPSDSMTYNPAARRPFRLSLSERSWKFEIQKQDGSYWSHSGTFPAPLSFSRGLVRFQHHAYNPEKDGISPQHTTFHWDNIRFDGPVVSANASYEVPAVINNQTGPTSFTVNLPQGGAGRLIGLLSSQLIWSPIESNIINADRWAQVRVNGGAWEAIRFRKETLTGLGGRNRSTIDTPLTFVAGNNHVEFQFQRPANATWQNNRVLVQEMEIQFGAPGSSPPPPPAQTPTATLIPTLATSTPAAGSITPTGTAATATATLVPATPAIATATPPGPSAPSPTTGPALPTATASAAPTQTQPVPPPTPPPPTPTDPTAGWTITASASPSRAIPGATETIRVNVSSQVARSGLVLIEIVDPSGRRVKQATFQSQSFDPSAAKTYPVQWVVPRDAAGGTYTVRAGVFAPDGRTPYHWNSQAATFTVSRSNTAQGVDAEKD